MSLAGDQHHVAFAGVRDRLGDGRRAIGLDKQVLARLHAGQDLVDDAVGHFAARVVAGDQHAVGILLGGLPHERPLGGVAVSAAAKDAPQPAPALFGGRAQGAQRLVQCVGRVGIVHGHQGLAGLRDLLHAAGHGLQVGAGRNGLVQVQAQAAQRSQHAQQVRYVVLADDARAHAQAVAGLDHGEVQAFGTHRDVLGLQAGRALDGDAPDIERGRLRTRLQRGPQARAMRIVHVDDGGLQAGPVEQRGLGLPVGLHAAVVVEVVLREIGEHRHADARTVQAVFDNADG
jgi:hypothetical protein